MTSSKLKNTPNNVERISSSKLSDLFGSDNAVQSEDEFTSPTDRGSNSSPGYNSNPPSGGISPYYALSPWNPSAASPFAKSPWIQMPILSSDSKSTGLVGSLVREEGHVYSLAATGDLLFTGSDSKNIRVWKGNQEFAGFKSGSGLVKAIVVANDKVFTGHQDGKIRVWRVSSNNPSVYKRIGTLPSMKDFLKSSINPSNYIQVRRNKNTVWLRHFDAVSCLSYDEDAGILYSGSWDKTVKVWRISSSKCLESIKAHDDAVNSVAAAGFDGIVFTGSADGTVKAWRRESVNNTTRHVLMQTLLQQDSAVTAVAVAPSSAGVVYCGCSDGMIHYWQWEKGRHRFVYGGALHGHRTAVLCLAAAGAVLASGSADKTISVWRRNGEGAHTRVAVLHGHEGPIKCLAIDRDFGEMRTYILYSGSLDRTVKIWRVSDKEEVVVGGGNSVGRSPLSGRSYERIAGGFGRNVNGGRWVQDVRV